MKKIIIILAVAVIILAVLISLFFWLRFTILQNIELRKIQKDIETLEREKHNLQIDYEAMEREKRSVEDELEIYRYGNGKG